MSTENTDRTEIEKRQVSSDRRASIDRRVNDTEVAVERRDDNRRSSKSRRSSN